MKTEIDLNKLADDELLQLSKDTGVGLSLEEMQRVRAYFQRECRNPTDVELQSIGQAWSEHCCYKSSSPILKQFVFNITNQDVIARDDAGVMAFDDEYAYALRIESHNHPSALEPYGGAATGIGGIVRDVLCMGAQPIALIDPLFFGPLTTRELPRNVRHPKYLFAGVVSGIRDYGNRIGIPTVAGSVYFDEGYTGNCIVNVGCVGIVKKEHVVRSMVKSAEDILVLVGGKTGRDGIHGVTFASRTLTETSEKDKTAVQLGDPITKEPLIHCCLEANANGWLDGMKDLGGGGLSCVVGEIALAGGFGAEVYLEKVPLKEPDMASWEIWVSESQERMMLAVKPENLDKVLDLFALWDVQATVVGRVIPEKAVRVLYDDKLVLNLDLEFLTKAPVYHREYDVRTVTSYDEPPNEPQDYNAVILALLAEPNLASKDWVIRQYDHEVRGGTVIKPLQGSMNAFTHGDATVLKPLEHSYRGLAIAVGTNPEFARRHPYRGGKAIVDEVCRNLVASGARPHSLTDCLNFGNPENPERLGEFYAVVKGMGEVASYLNLPIPSGNVSFYNETEDYAVPPTPVALGVGIVRDIRHCVSVALKPVRDAALYIIGETRPELGGSAYYKLTGAESANVPDVELAPLADSIDAMLAAIENGYVLACHDVADGGLALCISEMCIGSDIGAKLELAALGNDRLDLRLFSESNTRWLVQVSQEHQERLETLMRAKAVKSQRIGVTGGKALIIEDGARRSVELPLSELRRTWERPLWDLMG